MLSVSQFANTKQADRTYLNLHDQSGLISRTFLTAPAWATWSYADISNGDNGDADELLRSIQPAASFNMDNTTDFFVGGVGGIGNYAYTNASNALTALPGSYVYVSHKTAPVAARYHWKPGSRHSNPKTSWPSKGLALEVLFAPPRRVRDDTTDDGPPTTTTWFCSR